MKILIKLALVALAVETVNYFVLMPPLDVDLASDANWFVVATAAEWVVFHRLGFFLAGKLQEIGVDVWHSFAFPSPGFFLVFVSGYIETVCMLAAFPLICRWIYRTSMTRSSNRP